MGCSPPDWWYDQQDRAYFAEKKREHNKRVAQFLQDLKDMTADEKEIIRRELGLLS